MRKGITVVLILLLLAGCAHQSRTITDSSRYSKVETELGEAIHRQILQAIPVLKDEGLNRYVQSIGQKLASVADRKDLLYRFVILEDDRIYATHAPGGYVYITTGFFRFLMSEIELAGILVQEVTLLQYKDPRLSKAKKAFDMLLRTGSYVGPAFGSIGALSVLGLILIGSLTSGEKSLVERTQDADRKALRYMVESGYDPQGLMDPLQRMLQPTSPYRAYLYDYLQSHPISPKRFAQLDREFQKLPLGDKQFDAHREIYLTATQSVRSAFQRK